ncbi:MAG: glycosyltransferase family 39 protein [Chloroflexota bacterium]|nr:MAG: glycosyltransferase family 39 protein [Chloroflexota bacterium]
MEEKSFFGQSKIFLWIVIATLLLLGFAIRMVDLTDPPLDFHPTRQLRSAIIARTLYYRGLPETDGWQRQVALSQYTGEGIIEPLVMETIVATTYRVIGSDPVWVARVYSSLFWVIGGLGIYFLTSAMTSPDGGVLATAYYLFIPFGIIASRSFQPDPLMVMLIVLALWAVYYWYRKPTWKTAILAGILAGLALFVKAVALFPILFGLAAFLLVSKGIKNTIKDPQIWLIAGLSVLPMVAYTVYGVYILGSMESQFLGRFFPEMWRDLGFYFSWEDMTTGIVGYGPVFLALLGTLLFSSWGLRAFGIGLWVGYFLFGLTFPYHFTTHSYYHLPLIPIIAISLAPVGALLLRPLADLRPKILVGIGVVGILFAAIVIKAWDVRLDLAREDFRHEPAHWANIGEVIDHNPSVVGLVHDYGNRLTYYGWVTPKIWPPLGQQNLRNMQGKPAIEVKEWFDERAGNKDFFLVTMKRQFEKQPELKKLLEENFPVYAEGDGYLIYDLRNPIQ